MKNKNAKRKNLPNGLNSTLDTEKEKMASQQLRNKRMKKKKKTLEFQAMQLELIWK